MAQIVVDSFVLFVLAFAMLVAGMVGFALGRFWQLHMQLEEKLRQLEEGVAD